MVWNISKDKSYDYIIILLITTYISLSLILELNLFAGIQINKVHVVITGISIILFTLRNVKFNNISERIKITTFIGLILSVFIIINSFFVRNQIQFGALFNLVMGIVIGQYLASSKFSYKVILFPFWFILIFIIIKLFQNPNPNEVFIRSRNYISFFLIVTVLPYYFTRINSNKSISIFPAFLTLILSFYSLGRSGIVSSIILFIGVFLAHKIKRRNKKILGLFLLALIVSFFIFYLINYSTIKDIERITNSSNWSKLGGRSTFFKNYLDNSNLYTFFFGMDTNTYKILNIGGSYLPGHIHSSILNFISVTGIASFMFFIFLFKKIKRVTKVNLPIFFLFIALIGRIASESGCLFGYFDYVVWMFFFSNISLNHEN
jgi:hypothetical protein